MEHPRRNRALPTCGSGQPEKQSAGNTFSRFLLVPGTKAGISSLTSGSTDAKPRISPFCWRRLRVRQGIPTGAAGAASTALTAALWLLCCALLTQIRLWRKIWFHFQGFFFSVQSHLSPPRSAALTPGGIPCPKMLIRGEGTSWRAAWNRPCILSSNLPLIPAAPALIPLPWMAKSCPIHSQICSHSPSPC